MAVPTVQQYYRYRQWINCQGGGYLEDYNLLQAPASPTTYPAPSVLQTIKNIYCLRGQLLDGNSKMANAELSIETLPGINPPEGFNVPHNVANSFPILLNDPTTGVIEASIGTAGDPEQCMLWRLDTQTGFTELRSLRSLRASWVNQWSTLYPQIVAQLAGLSTNLPNPVLANMTFPGGSTNPAVCIAYFMMMVMQSTQLIQNFPLANSVTAFNAIPWKTPSSSGCPIVVNPILSPLLGRRKVGEGWPKTKGKMQTFGTHG